MNFKTKAVSVPETDKTLERFVVDIKNGSQLISYHKMKANGDDLVKEMPKAMFDSMMALIKNDLEGAEEMSHVKAGSFVKPIFKARPVLEDFDESE